MIYSLQIISENNFFAYKYRDADFGRFGLLWVSTIICAKNGVVIVNWYPRSASKGGGERVGTKTYGFFGGGREINDF